MIRCSIIKRQHFITQIVRHCMHSTTRIILEPSSRFSTSSGVNTISSFGSNKLVPVRDSMLIPTMMTVSVNMAKSCRKSSICHFFTEPKRSVLDTLTTADCQYRGAERRSEPGISTSSAHIHSHYRHNPSHRIP